MANTKEEIVTFFNLRENSSNPMLPLNWNVAPTNEIYIVKGADGARNLESASWGMIAPWQKSTAEARASQSHAINARSESIHEKPTFRDAFRRTRCLIPVTGYYEWATALGRYAPKQPFYISDRDGAQLSVAGIWSSWIAPNGEQINSASIITQEAQGELATIHSRMPVFMERARWDTWLDPSNRDIEMLRELMRCVEPERNLVTRPVDSRVNVVANNGPELIQEIALGEPETLF
jgi:putative SOS response-associated peptidase YedK